MITLIDKNILFFAPRFFNYENEIKNKFENLGAKVFYYDERINPTNLEKIVIRKAKNLILNKINSYYNDITSKTKDLNFDYIFFISPETVTTDIIKTLKKYHKNAKFILYMWDSIKNKNAYSILPYFDSKFSFDKKDCALYDLKFRPLFYLDSYSNINYEKTENKIDFSFIGSIHSDRLNILYKVFSQLSNNKQKIAFFCFFQSKLLFIFHILKNKKFIKNINIHYAFKPITKNKVFELLKNSNSIIDIQHPNQLGLTMRTIEVLAMKKKLITTNSDIVNYDFYNSNNIYVINRQDAFIDPNFINQSYEEISEDIYRNYSIEAWISEIFSV